jgi:hypothetical protein
MGRAVRVRLDPDGQELEIGFGVRVNGGPPLGVGAGDLAVRRGDDFEVGSGGHGSWHQNISAETDPSEKAAADTNP